MVLTCREHAQLNPRAVWYGKPLTMEEYLRSDVIASPLRILDCDMPIDGAVAAVLVAASRVPDLPKRPIYLNAMASATRVTASVGSEDKGPLKPLKPPLSTVAKRLNFAQNPTSGGIPASAPRRRYAGEGSASIPAAAVQYYPTKTAPAASPDSSAWRPPPGSCAQRPR